MKEIQTNKGLYQSVQPNQIKDAQKAACELNALLFNDFYKGHKITGVSYEDNLPEKVKTELGTDQAILFQFNY